MVQYLYGKLCFAEESANKQGLPVSRDAGVDHGADAFQQEDQPDRHADCRNAHPRIHHADEPGRDQNDADGQNPSPSANATGAQIKCADEPRNAGKQKPQRKQKRQRHHGEPLVQQQKQGKNDGQHAVK